MFLSEIAVSLLVRLWVEMIMQFREDLFGRSASLWGCELKLSTKQYKKIVHGQPPCEAVSWNTFKQARALLNNVSLLVRLWVEIVSVGTMIPRAGSASLWGCELKCCRDINCKQCLCQPPCEAVSWNYGQRFPSIGGYNRQPPCEAVSWNNYPVFQLCGPIVSLLVRLWVEITYLHLHYHLSAPSASLWGCELKYVVFRNETRVECQPPCEAVSWNN